jgi:hypothetical protein
MNFYNILERSILWKLSCKGEFRKNWRTESRTEGHKQTTSTSHIYYPIYVELSLWNLCIILSNIFKFDDDTSDRQI